MKLAYLIFPFCKNSFYLAVCLVVFLMNCKPEQSDHRFSKAPDEKLDSLCQHLITHDHHLVYRA
jgi:hypothetical protein